MILDNCYMRFNATLKFVFKMKRGRWTFKMDGIRESRVEINI